MPYYVTLFTKVKGNIPVPLLNQALLDDELEAVIDIEEAVNDEWASLLVRHFNEDDAICIIEKHSLNKTSVKDMVTDFLADLNDVKPDRARKWVQDYLKSVKDVYSFQLLGGIDEGEGRDIFDVILSKLQEDLVGIVHAEGEGFTNEEGSQILWEFGDDVDGEWPVAILNEEGNWVSFLMDLGNPKHRDAFLKGIVPDGVKLL